MLSTHRWATREFRRVQVQGHDEALTQGSVRLFPIQAPRATRWRPFKVGLGGSDGNGFYLLNKDRPRDAIDGRHRWNSNFFTPSVPQGPWKLRAIFRKQDNYARSQVVKKYWVWASD